MAIRPVKFLIVNFALGSATATIPSGTWAGYPYQWNATLTVTAQPHGSDETTPQFFYDGTNVKVGDCIATQGQGRFLFIVSISSQGVGTVNCVVEDRDYENVYQDATQAGDGAISDGEGYLFEIVDGVPILHPIPDALAGAIPPYFASSVMLRFFARESLVEIVVEQADHGFVPGNPIYLTQMGSFAKAYAGTEEASRVVGIVSNTDYGVDKFRFRPMGQKINAPMPAGGAGSIVYLSSVVGVLTTSPSQGDIPLMIKLGDNSAIAIGGSIGGLAYSSSSSSSFSSSSFSSSSFSSSSSSFSSSSSSFSSSSLSYSSSSSSSSYDTITRGTAVVFESASCAFTRVARLTDDKAIVCYCDVGNSYYGTAVIITISGTTITVGSPVIFESAQASHISVAALSSSSAIVTYGDDGNSGAGTACVLFVSGNVITVGSPYVFESGETAYTSVVSLDSSTALVSYQDGSNNNYGTICKLSIFSGIITPGTPTVFSGEVSSTILNKIDSSNAILTYTGSNGYAMTVNVSGSTITFGTATVFEDGGMSNAISVGGIDSETFVVAYRDGNDSGYGKARILSVSGATITAGNAEIFDNVSIYSPSVVGIDSSTALVCYADYGNDYYGMGCILTISGSTIDAGVPSLFEESSVSNVSSAVLNGVKIVTVYRDSGNSGYGTAVCLTLS